MLEAMLIAKGHVIFPEQPDGWETSSQQDGISHACGDDVHNLSAWQGEMDAKVAAQNCEARLLREESQSKLDHGETSFHLLSTELDNKKCASILSRPIWNVLLRRRKLLRFVY